MNSGQSPRLCYEFFAGGGMARLGLEAAGLKCVFANDFDARKCAAYRENFGGEHLVEGDVAALRAEDLPSQADVAWASFPCQDLSLAGGRSGLDGGRSASFWPFWRLMRTLDAQERGPKVIAIENVVGLASSNGGADFAALADALAQSGRRFCALMIDARLFTPQSRPRLFILAWRGETPQSLRAQTFDPQWTPPALQAAIGALSAQTRAACAPLALKAPRQTPPRLADLVEEGLEWAPAEKTRALLKMMSTRQHAALENERKAAHDSGERRVGCLYRRTRASPAGERVQRAEARFDVAGCLRTPAGGSSRQTLIVLEPSGEIRSRLLSAREAARLMGLPESYRLPKRYNDAYRLMGDGVAAPVVRFLAQSVISPLLAASATPNSRNYASNTHSPCVAHAK